MLMYSLNTLRKARGYISMPPFTQNMSDFYRHYTNSSELDDEKEKEIKRIQSNASLEEPPTSCCQSGCANCVFIVWAEALSEKMEAAGPEIAEKIIKMVEDPSMKAYLELELRIRGLKK